MTLLTLALGVLAHTLKQMLPARRAGTWPGLTAYFVDYWPETLLAAICSVGLWMSLPELAALIPALGAAGARQSHLLAFLLGYAGNSFADILGDRAKRLAGG